MRHAIQHAARREGCACASRNTYYNTRPLSGLLLWPRAITRQSPSNSPRRREGEMAECPPSSCRLKNGLMLVVAFTGLFIFISYASINSCGAVTVRQDFMSAWGCTRQRQTSPATIRVGLSPASMARNETDGLQPVSVASNEAEAGTIQRCIIGISN